MMCSQVVLYISVEHQDADWLGPNKITILSATTIQSTGNIIFNVYYNIQSV